MRGNNKTTKKQEIADFLDTISRINTLQESFKSSLLPISHKSCAVLLSYKCEQLWRLLEVYEVEALRESAVFESLERFIERFITAFKPKLCYFDINEMDSPAFRDIKKLANQLLTEKMLKV